MPCDRAIPFPLFIIKVLICSMQPVNVSQYILFSQIKRTSKGCFCSFFLFWSLLLFFIIPSCSCLTCDYCSFYFVKETLSETCPFFFQLNADRSPYQRTYATQVFHLLVITWICHPGVVVLGSPPSPPLVTYCRNFPCGAVNSSI